MATTAAVPAGDTYSSAIDRAKKAIAPGADLKAWLRQPSESAAASHSIHVHSGANAHDGTTTAGCSSYVAFGGADGGGGGGGGGGEHDLICRLWQRKFKSAEQVYSAACHLPSPGEYIN